MKEKFHSLCIGVFSPLLKCVGCFAQPDSISPSLAIESQLVLLCLTPLFMPDATRPTKLTETLLQSTGGYELVFSALILGFLGYAVDQWLNTTPRFVLAFSVFGFLGAAFSLYYRFKHQLRLLANEQQLANQQPFARQQQRRHSQ